MNAGSFSIVYGVAMLVTMFVTYFCPAWTLDKSKWRDLVPYLFAVVALGLFWPIVWLFVAYYELRKLIAKCTK